MRRLLPALALLLAVPVWAQAPGALWTDVAEAPVAARGVRVTVPTSYRVVRLDVPQMAARLAASPAAARSGDLSGGVLLSLPLPEGGAVEVRVVEASVMAPELQAQYPEIRTYLAQGPGAVHGRLSRTPAGFRGMLFTAEGTVYIDPYAHDPLRTAETYIVYRAADLHVDPAARGRLSGDVVEGADAGLSGPNASARANGDTKRTYRLAMAATGEYTAFHGGTVSGGLAAIVATVNRVTAVYERDLSVGFTLVANNNLIVYTNASTDPYANTSGDLSANITTINSVIGAPNYDIGHLVGTGGGGVAGLGVVCGTSKARGLTGSSSPVGDAFDIDYVAHEMGHQFAGNHTFNGNVGSCAGGNRSGTHAYEPGSGTTIMAYAGICGAQDLQPNSDALFHAESLREISTFITTGAGSTCGTAVATGNPIPTVTPPAAVTIPISTPFALTGSATDDTPGTLTYIWEGFSLGAAGAPGSATPPLFRSFVPTASPTRYFPQLNRLVAGVAPVIGETLPTTSQTLAFRLTARDNRAGGGAVNDADVAVTTTTTAGPFTVTFANTANQTYAGTATVTWNVAGTNAGAVNTPTVDILLSTDNGTTFSTVLAAATPNDGSELVSFPVSTTNGRVMVRAVGNVFFNVNPQRFTATAAQQTIAGAAGWRLLAAPASGFTVDDLAAMNLVQGVPGYYPGAGANLLTGYTGSAYTSAGTGTVLAPGRGFWWYLYNENRTPGGASNSTALPTTLATSRPAVTSDVTVALHASGTRFNLLGNPFGTSLTVSGVAGWPGATALASNVVQVWNAAGSTYESSVTRPTISAWQGFWAEAATAATLTIPASARTTGGTLTRPANAADSAGTVIAFELASADSGSTLVDRAAVLVMGDGRESGPDRGDASKLAPVSATHVVLAFAPADGVSTMRAVESRPVEAFTIPMAAVSVGAGADLVLTWPRLDGLPEGWTAVLRDLATGTAVDLATEARYAFSVVPTAARAAEAVPAGARLAAVEPRFVLAVGPRGATATEGGAAAVFALDAPAPNPARGTVAVSYSLAEAGATRVSLVDLLGREVAVVVAGEQAAGGHAASLDVSGLAPGVYVVRLSSGGDALARRIVVVR
ncbi:MAG TPA: zinc-dependent metalloprotease [Rubricoccaceae bacterium]|jgi:hypothetical protein